MMPILRSKQMVSNSQPNNAYTDAPNLHASLLLGSLQLLFWLFFHPSAWRNHVTRFEPPLRPIFGLAELSRDQWRHPEIRRILVMGYGILPMLAGFLLGLSLWLLGVSGQDVLLSVAIGIVSGIGLGMTSSLIVGTSVGIIAGLATSVGVGFGAGIWLMLDLGTRNPPTGRPIDILIDTLIFAIAFGIFFGISENLIREKTTLIRHPKQRFTSLKQVASMSLGIVLSGLIIFPVGFGLVSGRVDILVLSLGVIFMAGLAVGWGRSPVAGVIIAGAIALGLYFAFIASPGFSLLGPILFCATLAPVYILFERLAGPLPAAIICALGGGGGWVASTIAVGNSDLWLLFPVSLLIIAFGLTVFRWRPILLYPLESVWNNLLRYADESRTAAQPAYLRWHTAFWDESQRFPLFGLEEHLLLILERNPTEGQAALEYLSTSPQRWAAQAAQIELEACWLESCTEIAVIGSIHRSLSAGELTGPASALLRSFSRISRDVMAALQQGSAYNQRLALSSIEDRLDALLRELTRSSERYAIRFRPIATSWRKVIAVHRRDLAKAVELRQEIDSPYIVGLPLTEQQEIFVGRTNISARIEQLMLDRHRPPLLLYGQRRMGKTSLLNNLGRLLPSTIVPLFIDLQGPASKAQDYTSFFYNIARAMIDTAQRQRNLTLPRLPRERLATDPFTYFDEWVDEVEEVLGDHTALVTLDEFEALESAIDRGNLDGETLWGMMRYIIQHRPRFKILLTSSQTLEEFQRWSSYLINVQVVHISYLNEDETLQLIERPVRNFPLRYQPEASQRVLELTRGHPFLVQLLCSEIVALKNEQSPKARRLTSVADVETILPEVLQRGSLFFADIERNQITPSGLNLLRFLAKQGEGAIVSEASLADHIKQPPPIFEKTLKHLRRRELIEAQDGGYRFQVELIRRWFAQT